MDSEALLGGLNDAQAVAVTTDGAPVVVLAGAGSGKTRVLTRRIAWRIATDQTDPNRVLALTFTRKAAGELRHRLQALGMRDQVNAGTFHALALLQLRQRWAERNVTPPTLLKSKVRFISGLLTSMSSQPKAGGQSKASGRSSSRGRNDALDVAAEIDWARARLVGPDHYRSAAAEAGRTPPIPAEQISELLVSYQQEKQRKRVVDFDDLLMLAIRDLRTDHRYAEAIRWRYRHLYVDEFQDVNPLQYELLSAWRGDRTDLFVVGDPNQAIYGWNGADPNLLSRFVRREPNATVVELRDNYRSTPQVLALAASMTTSGEGLVPNRSDGMIPTITAYPDDRAEAIGIASRVREAHSVAGRWADQAVLVRTNAQLPLIEQVLTDAGVPTRLRGGSGPLATPEVRTELKLLARPGVDLPAALNDLNDRLNEPMPNASVAVIERRANLAAFVRLVNDYVATDPLPSGPGLEAWIGTLQSGDIEADVDAVELATFHASKGLEWDVVHIAGLEDGFVPIAYATNGAQITEEKRLLYVAVTRAMEELHLSWAAERTFTNKPVNRQPSPHLGPLADGIARLGVGPAHRVDWREQIAKSRQSLAAVAPPEGTTPGAAAGSGLRDPSAPPTAEDHERAVYAALKQWRLRKAKAADVPPHAVFSDRTLRAIASEQPTTRARMGSMPGMGPAKLARYGEDLLQVVAEKAPLAPGEPSAHVGR